MKKETSEIVVKSGTDLKVVEQKEGNSIEGFISMAIEKGLPVETLERLLVMRTQLKKEKAIEEFNIAMCGFQSACPVIEKESKANITTKTGAKFGYTYAPIEDIVEQTKPLLFQYGFSYAFSTDYKDACQIVTCTIRHIGGHSESSQFRAPIETDAGMSLVQKNVAALSFGERCAYRMVLGIVTKGEDNDGQKPKSNANLSDFRVEGTPLTREQVLQDLVKKFGEARVVEVKKNLKITEALLKISEADFEKVVKELEVVAKGKEIAKKLEEPKQEELPKADKVVEKVLTKPEKLAELNALLKEFGKDKMNKAKEKLGIKVKLGDLESGEFEKYCKEVKSK